MNTTDVSKTTLWRVGLFTLLGLGLVGAITVFVNDKPFWWRKCNLVSINVEDATGLKTKSPIRSLGLQIGYLKSVELAETKVRLGICITAPVEIIPDTRAYVRGEGFLGDKFVELKPVRYLGEAKLSEIKAPKDEQKEIPSVESSEKTSWLERSLNALVPSAYAEGPETAREVPVGKSGADMDKLMNQMGGLVSELTDLTKNLKEGLNPKDLKQTVQSLNKTLDAASKTLGPEGGLNSTARRALLKLEDSFEQLRQQMTRINHGEGSLGKLLNDPIYAEEVLKAVKNLNKLLSKAADVRFNIDLGVDQVPVYDGGRGRFQLGIWPSEDRYYLVGIAIDPRGKRNVTTTTTTAGGMAVTTQTEQIDQGGLLLTGMIGKVFFRRLDISAGAIYGDGAASVAINLGPKGMEDVFVFRNDIYSRGQGIAINDRITMTVRPLAMIDGFRTLYIRGGVDGVRQVSGKTPWLVGAGVSFDDEDIKLLFTLK